jgi:epsilon-lactone hydrolase
VAVVASPQLEQLNALLATGASRLEPPFTAVREKMILSTASLPLPPGVTIAPDVIAGVEGERHRVEGARDDAVLLFLHGGAYVAGSPLTNRPFASHVAAAVGLDAFVPDYRLAPEHPFPAGLDDAVAVYRALRAAHHVVVAGDSAGGGLALSLLVRLRDVGDSMPACALLLSPWTDMALSVFETSPFPDTETILSLEMLREAAAHYTGEADPSDPCLQPLGADLSGLPPTMIQVGDGECLLHDARRIDAAADACGVSVLLEEWPDCPHEWQSLAGFGIPESNEALASLAAFTSKHV